MLFIINPKAANKKAEKKWYKEIEPILEFKGMEYHCIFTEYPNHATELAKAAIKEGEEKFIVAVGGDGTFNEVANGLFENNQPIDPQCILGVISCGTGSDFIKTAEIPKLFTDAVNILESGEIQRQDVGIARFTDFEGNPSTRLFINVADTGLGGDVVNRVNRTTKRLGGKMTFLIGSIRGIIHHHKAETRIILDNNEATAYEFNANMTCVCIGKYFGGGMMISPNSISTDGLFNIITIQDASRWKLLRNIGKIYDGSHLKMPEVIEHPLCKKIQVISEDPVFLDLDGEQVTKAETFEFEIIPKSLPVKIGKSEELSEL
ncbi:MAG: diacylglycerol kinase family lipid kinase [Candidatus Helarchaeota archaeon]|nr:diacylglycerol kinase family lipid kinase [Candidatus Helarchaeota archaeon]